MSDFEWKLVTVGTYLYDGIVPTTIEIYAKPAQFAADRWDYDDQIDESVPIPETPDGLVYSLGKSLYSDFQTLDEVKKWCESQPWAPIDWA